MESYNTGFIYLWRKIKQNPLLWKNSVNCHFFMYCLLNACFEPQEVVVKGKKVKLKPGQFIFGRSAAATELGLSEATAYRTAKRLEKNSILNIKSTPYYSIITVVNWGKYQGAISKGEQKSDSKVNRKATGKRQGTAHNKININKGAKATPLNGVSLAPKKEKNITVPDDDDDGPIDWDSVPATWEE